MIISNFLTSSARSQLGGKLDRPDGTIFIFYIFTAASTRKLGASLDKAGVQFRLKTVLESITECGEMTLFDTTTVALFNFWERCFQSWPTNSSDVIAWN